MIVYDYCGHLGVYVVKHTAQLLNLLNHNGDRQCKH